MFNFEIIRNPHPDEFVCTCVIIEYNCASLVQQSSVRMRVVAINNEYGEEHF